MTNSLWSLSAYALQLAALVTVALAATWLMRIRIPRHALRFWQAVLAIALLLPFAQPRRVDPGGLLRFTQTLTASSSQNADTATPPGVDIASVILLVLAAGIAARLLWLGIGVMRLRGIVARATDDESFTAITSELSQTLGVSAAVKISGDLEGPATVGARNPLVLVPPSVLGMSPAVQRAIICHELVHVKRRDWLHTIAEEVWCALFWFHPLARVIASRLSLARETVVDEITIETTRDRRAYAEALLAFSNPQPHVIGVTPFIGRRTLSQRISLIAQEAPMSHHRALAGSCLAFTACLAITALAVTRVPMFTSVQAQSQVYEAGPGMTLPRVIHEVRPDYTREAMNQLIQGSVWLKVVIDERGDVTDAQVTNSLDKEYGLDQAAVDAARQWKFEPARKDDKPVAVWVTVEMTFTLK